MPEGNIGILGTLIDLIVYIPVFLIMAYICSQFLTFLTPIIPSYLLVPLQASYNSVFGFFDASFIFIFVFVLMVDILNSYVNPNLIRGVVNILFLFALAYLSLIIRIPTFFLNQTLNFSVLFPAIYSFFANNYYVVIVFFALIIAIIFDFRPHATAREQYAGSEGVRAL